VKVPLGLDVESQVSQAAPATGKVGVGLVRKERIKENEVSRFRQDIDEVHLGNFGSVGNAVLVVDDTVGVPSFLSLGGWGDLERTVLVGGRVDGHHDRNVASRKVLGRISRGVLMGQERASSGTLVVELVLEKDSRLAEGLRDKVLDNTKANFAPLRRDGD
jgi:hypothetical protein